MKREGITNDSPDIKEEIASGPPASEPIDAGDPTASASAVVDHDGGAPDSNEEIESRKAHIRRLLDDHREAVANFNARRATVLTPLLNKVVKLRQQRLMSDAKMQMRYIEGQVEAIARRINNVKATVMGTEQMIKAIEEKYQVQQQQTYQQYQKMQCPPPQVSTYYQQGSWQW